MDYLTRLYRSQSGSESESSPVAVISTITPLACVNCLEKVTGIRIDGRLEWCHVGRGQWGYYQACNDAETPVFCADSNVAELPGDISATLIYEMNPDLESGDPVPLSALVKVQDATSGVISCVNCGLPLVLAVVKGTYQWRHQSERGYLFDGCHWLAKNPHEHTDNWATAPDGMSATSFHRLNPYCEIRLPINTTFRDTVAAVTASAPLVACECGSSRRSLVSVTGYADANQGLTISWECSKCGSSSVTYQEWAR